MQNALSVTWETVTDWWNGLVGLATLNVIWLGLSLTIILFPPATAGMYAVTNSIAHGQGQHLNDFRDAMRQYVWLSLRWALLNLIVAAIFVVNFVFYGSISGTFALVLQVVVSVMGALWLSTQFYVWPFVMEQEDKRLRVALRNGLLLTLATPLYTLTLLIVSLLVIAISLALILPAAVFTLSFLALLGNRAVIERLTAFGKLRRPASPSTPGEEP